MSWFGFSSSPSKQPAAADKKKKKPTDDGTAAEVTLTRTEEQGGVIFTAGKCPPAPELDSSCELPFGFVWTPMVGKLKDNPNAVVVDSLPPILCLNCLAYLNPYAEFDKSTGIWVCPLCEHENVTPKDQFNAPAFTSKIVEYHQPVPVAPTDEEDDEEKDVEGGLASAAADNVFEGTTYYLVVDSHLDGADGLAIAEAMETIVQNSETPVRFALIVFDQFVKLYRLGVPGVVSADVYMPLDDDATEEDLLERKKEIEERAYLVETDASDGVAASLDRCLSAVFGMPGDESDKKTVSRKELLKKKKEVRKLKEVTNGSAREFPAESPWVKDRGQKKHPQRSTGDAIQAALDMIGVVDPSIGTRVLLFTNGCPNVGEGSVVLPEDMEDIKQHDVIDADMLSKSVEYFDLMANVALEAGVGIDVFCAGSNELGLPAYQSLVDPSGGYVVTQLSFDVPQLEHNLKFLLEETYLARPKNDIAEESDDKPEVYLDIRSDSFMDPAQLVGPGEIVPVETDQMMDSELEAFLAGSELAEENGLEVDNLPMEEAVAISMTRIKLARFDPLTTLAVMCQVNDTMEEEDSSAFFQFITRYYDREGEKIITRVLSHKIDVAEDVGEFVSSVDDEAVSVVLAKSAVYRAVHGRDETEGTKDKILAGDVETLEKLSYEAQLDMDATIQRISGAYRLLTLEKSMKNIDLSEVTTRPKDSSQSSLDFAFPPQLKDTLNRLYHLRRGPLISPGPMQSMDDRAGTRGLCLRFPLEDCLKMMAPETWTTGDLEGVRSPYATMNDTLSETLALWDHCIVASDCYDGLYVWSGSECTGTTYDHIRAEFKEFLEGEAESRFPMPSVQMVVDGDSQSRRFTARLAPSHADPRDHQLAHFPGLEDLSKKSLNSLLKKFKFYDSESDASFRTWFWSVASATNASKDDGVSLCE